MDVNAQSAFPQMVKQQTPRCPVQFQTELEHNPSEAVFVESYLDTKRSCGWR